MGFASDMSHRLLLALFAIVFASVAHAQMYRWVDKQGKVHYTDTPPPPSEVKKVEEKKFSGNVVGGTSGSYSAEKAAKDYPVTLYTGDCGDACKSAKTLLTKRGVPFVERLPATNPVDAEAFKKISSENFIPILVVGSMVIKGYTEEQWHSALDVAGYPKSSGTSTPAAGNKKPY